jgi:hypothetical protein
VGWAAALPVATWIASRPHSAPLPYSFPFVVYGIGAWICHQRPERSFYLWSMQMPVCARCSGIYVGAAVATLVVRLQRPGDAARPRADAARLKPRAPSSETKTTQAVVALAVLPTILTLLFEWTTGVVPANWIRAIAGLPIGAAVAWMVRQAEVN